MALFFKGERLEPFARTILLALAFASDLEAVTFGPLFRCGLFTRLGFLRLAGSLFFPRRLIAISPGLLYAR